MDLIELVNELSYDEVIELFARKVLATEQEFIKIMVDDPDTGEDDKELYREIIAAPEKLAESAQDSCFENWFHYNNLARRIDTVIDNIAEEYTRTL